jgi:hypothetical protein
VTSDLPAEKRGDKPKSETFPAGSLVIRMDQPYSRVADVLLDRQFWAPDDAQKHPYDDTGWSFPHLFNLKVMRVVDPAILQAKMTPLDDAATLAGKISGAGPVIAVANTAQVSLLPLVFKLKGAGIQVADKDFEAEGKHYAAGTLLITGTDDSTLRPMLHDLALDAVHLAAAPSVASHAATAPRVALMHTWLSTQTEGWWRYASQRGRPARKVRCHRLRPGRRGVRREHRRRHPPMEQRHAVAEVGPDAKPGPH